MASTTEELIEMSVPEDLKYFKTYVLRKSGRIYIRSKLMNVSAIDSFRLFFSGIEKTADLADDGFYEFAFPDTNIDTFLLNIVAVSEGETYSTEELRYKMNDSSGLEQTVYFESNKSISIRVQPTDSSLNYSNGFISYLNRESVLVTKEMTYDSYSQSFMVNIDETYEDGQGNVVPLPFTRYRFSVQREGNIQSTTYFQLADASFSPLYEIKEEYEFSPPKFKILFKPGNFIPNYVKLYFNGQPFDVDEENNIFYKRISPSPGESYEFYFAFNYSQNYDPTNTESYNGFFPTNFTDDLGVVLGSFSSPGIGDDPDVILDGNSQDNDPVIDGNVV